MRATVLFIVFVLVGVAFTSWLRSTEVTVETTDSMTVAETLDSMKQDVEATLAWIKRMEECREMNK